MSGLSIEVIRREGETEALFKGQIDEDADFGPLAGESAPKLIFNLEGVELINSCGIRDWIEFQKTLSPGSKIVYRRCPQPIVEQLNIVKGFIRSNSEVESFYAPYYNEKKDEEVKILLSPGQIVDGKAPAQKDSEGNELEFDEIEAQYFAFLKNL